MRLLVLALLFTSVFNASAARQTPKVSGEDLRRLTGARWTGTLTYLDYRSKKPVSIPSNLLVSQAEGDESSFVFEYGYPKEPRANGGQTLKISDDGTVIDGQAVVERASLGSGVLRLVTVKRGRDDDKEALFRFTYTIAASSFSIMKEVRPEGAAEFFERNRYSWQR